MELTKRGFISGYPDQTFKPNDRIKVDEFIKILISALDGDIKPSTKGYWAENYIKRALDLKIIQEGDFLKYDLYITRGEMASIIVRVSESLKNTDLHLKVPEDYEKYEILIIDLYGLNKREKDVVLKIFASGIITGFPDGSFGYDKLATRAEASAIMMRFLEKDRRTIPTLPEIVDFSNTLSVEEFTIEVLEAIGEKAKMDNAFDKGYIRYEAEYPTYQKPILRREAALTMARVMDELTGMPALFTTGRNDLFVEGKTLNHRLQPYQIDTLINQNGREYFTLLNWENYRGHIKDINMVTEEYQKEMVTLYLAGIIDVDNQQLNPYDFLTKKEAEKWIMSVKEYATLNQTEVLAKLTRQIRDLEENPMPEAENPSNASLWGEIYPYVDKSLYEYPLPTIPWYGFYNKDMYERKFPGLKNYTQVYKNYYNTKYTVDYRNLQGVAPYYSTFNDVGGIGDYRTRFLFFYNPAHVVNHEEKDKSKWILPEDIVDKEIENIKKNQIVSQSELITHGSLQYMTSSTYSRATLRIIFYPPTNSQYLKNLGLEVGKWYEKDILILMDATIDGPEEYRDRWESSYFGTPAEWDLSDFRPIK